MDSLDSPAHTKKKIVPVTVSVDVERADFWRQTAKGLHLDFNALATRAIQEALLNRLEVSSRAAYFRRKHRGSPRLDSRLVWPVGTRDFIQNK
jgi:hypothetical protein